jgi:hypothetical protein
MAWTVVFFENVHGHVPVGEFLTRLFLGHRAKAPALIKMLEREGPSLPFPYSSQVRGRLRELRTQQGKDKILILYFGEARRVFVLLHGILKRSTQMPEEAIRAEEERMQRHDRRLEANKR